MLEEDIIFVCSFAQIGEDVTLHEYTRIRPKSIYDIVIIVDIDHWDLGIC